MEAVYAANMRALVTVLSALGLAAACKPGGDTKPQATPPAPSPSVSALPTIACSASCGAKPIGVLRRSENVAIATDGKDLYYVAAHVASVARVPTTGGPRTILAQTTTSKEGSFGATEIAVSDTDVYWLHERRKILRVPKAGGEPTVAVPEDGRTFQHVAIRNGELWWTTFTDVAKADAGPIDIRVSKWVNGAATPVSVPLTQWTSVSVNDESAAVGIDGAAHALVETTLTTGARVVLATGIAEKAEVIAIDKTNAYLIEGDALSRVARGKPGKKEPLGSVAGYVSAVVDSKDLWIAVTGGLLRVPLDSGKPRMHDNWAPSRSDRYVVPVVDDTAVYLVIDSGEGKDRARLLARVLK
jgi:hypothetical protein